MFRSGLKGNYLRIGGARILQNVGMCVGHSLSLADVLRSFYHGCSTFLPIFDLATDTYDSLHERSPFAVDSICMVAAHVRDGGGRLKPGHARLMLIHLFILGKPSDVYNKCLQEVQAISCATLFAPVMRHEAVQAMSMCFDLMIFRR